MTDEVKNAILSEKVKKGSKVAFVFLHIANVLFSLFIVPRVFLIPTHAESTIYKDGVIPTYFNLEPPHDALMIGFAVGGALLILNFFVIRFLKNYTTWYIEKNITE